MRNHDQLVAELMRRPGVQKEVERLEREAQKQLVASAHTSTASDWDNAFTSRSATELRARVSKRRAKESSTQAQLDEARLAALVRARMARGKFVLVDPKDI